MKLRDVVAVVVTAFVVVFVVQNLHSVEVQVLPWRVSVSAAILILTPFLVGLVIGRTATLFPSRRSPPPIEKEEQTPALPNGSGEQGAGSGEDVSRER